MSKKIAIIGATTVSFYWYKNLYPSLSSFVGAVAKCWIKAISTSVGSD